MQRKWIFLWVPVIVKGMIADSENVLDNNPVNMKYTPRKENAWHVCGRVSCISKASRGWFGLF